MVCSITMKNRTPQAMLTLHLAITITHPPSCPRRFTRTKTVAKNFPQPHDASIYSRCSLHWNHIRKPSSRNVAIRHSRASIGSTCLPLRITCKIILISNDNGNNVNDHMPIYFGNWITKLINDPFTQITKTYQFILIYKFVPIKFW